MSFPNPIPDYVIFWIMKPVSIGFRCWIMWMVQVHLPISMSIIIISLSHCRVQEIILICRRIRAIKINLKEWKMPEKYISLGIFCSIVPSLQYCKKDNYVFEICIHCVFSDKYNLLYG